MRVIFLPLVLVTACAGEAAPNSVENVAEVATAKGHAAQIANAFTAGNVEALGELTRDRIVYVPRSPNADLKKISAAQILKALTACSIIKIEEAGARPYVDGESVEIRCMSPVKECGPREFAFWDGKSSAQGPVYKLQYIGDDYLRCAPTLSQMLG